MRLQLLVVRELRKQRRCVTNREPFARAAAHTAPLRAMNVNMNVNVNINVNINVNDYNRGGDFEGLKLKM